MTKFWCNGKKGFCPHDDDVRNEVLEDWHPGLPGYAPEPEEACAACRVGGQDG